MKKKGNPAVLTFDFWVGILNAQTKNNINNNLKKCIVKTHYVKYSLNFERNF